MSLQFVAMFVLEAVSLENDIEGRESELRTTEHGRDLLRIVGHVRSHRVHIAPGPLDRVVEEYPPAAARVEHPVDGSNAPVDRLRGIPAVTGTLGQRDLGEIGRASCREGGEPVWEAGQLRRAASSSR